MPLVPFADLPDSARVWVFAAHPAIVGAPADTLLAETDRFLAGWRAHGAPLRCGRDWRDNRFLTIGVDPTAEQASGCSIDGLFRALQQVQQQVGSQLVGGGRLFYRDAGGEPRMAALAEVGALSQGGTLTGDTPVFDTTVTSLGEWRTSFELPAARATRLIAQPLSRRA